MAEGGPNNAEPITEGPFGLKSSKQGQEEAPVNDRQVQNPATEAAGHVLGHESTSRLDRTLNRVENTMVSTNDCALKDMVGTYEFQDEEKGVFRHLVSVMRRLALGNFALAASSVIVTASKAARHRAENIPYIVMRGFGISSIAYFLDALVAGSLVWMAAVSFKQANQAPPEQQLPHVFQGLMQIGVMFTQVTTITVCLAVVQSLEAAVRWPDIVLVAAVGCAVLAAVRTAAMGLVMAKYTPGSGKGTMALMGMRDGKSQHIPWLDKAAITVVGGLLLPFSMPSNKPTQDDEKEASGDESASQGRNTRQDKGGSKQNNGEEGEEGKEGSKDPGYNFSMTETTILEVVMDSMRTCGLALALQALSTIMLGAAVVLNGGVTDMFSYLTQFLEQTIRGSLLFSAASCFHEVVSSDGRDMKHLLVGLGKERGMGLLFYRMQKVAIGAAIFKTADCAVPFITRTALFKSVYHKVMNVVLAVLPNAISNIIAAHI